LQRDARAGNKRALSALVTSDRAKRGWMMFAGEFMPDEAEDIQLPRILNANLPVVGEGKRVRDPTKRPPASNRRRFPSGEDRCSGTSRSVVTGSKGRTRDQM